MAPKSFAPTLFKKAKRKNVMLQKAIQDNKWISHITPILSTAKIQEYVRLWEAVQLDASREDSIIWRWTADGEYIQECIPHSI